MRKPQKIAQYTLEGEFIRMWDSVSEASEYYGVPHQLIGTVCVSLSGNSVGVQRYTGIGYRWLYEKDMERAEDIFNNLPVPKRYTDEEIIEYVKNSGAKTQTELISTKEGKNYYCLAQKHGILDKLPLDRELNPYQDNLYWVYAYFFNETHSVYVGITCRKEREKEHNGECMEKSELSAVWEHAVENNLQVPDPVHLEDDLDPETALFLENEYREYYRLMGWNILNKAPTGVSSGSLGQCKKISNKKIIKAASECSTLSEFREKYPSFLKIAYIRGIVDKLGLERERIKKGTYTEEYCYNVASTCKSIDEFTKKHASIHSTALREGYSKQYWWLFDKTHRSIIAWKGFKFRVFKDISSAAKGLGCTKYAVSNRIQSKSVIEGWRFQYLDKVEPDAKLHIPDFEHRLVV